MSQRRPVSGFLVLLVGSLVAGGCEDLIEKLHGSRPTAPGGNAGSPGNPGTPNDPGTPGTQPPGATPPAPPVGPAVDGGAAPTTPVPSDTLCRSTQDCKEGTCSTEWGVCNAAPGCGPGVACPAVCYGTCQLGKPVCRVDADCRLVSDYCKGCDCRALGLGEVAPACDGGGVQCLVDPCQRKTAVCAARRCVAADPPPAPCAPTELAGDETTCRSQEEWKVYAYEACRKKGMELTAYSTGGGDCGAGRTRMVKFDCCPSRPTPPPPATTSPPMSTPPSPPTPPVGNACFGGHDGSASSCKPDAVWRQYAAEACARQNATLTEIAFGEPCGGGNHRYMKYVCCTK